MPWSADPQASDVASLPHLPGSRGASGSQASSDSTEVHRKMPGPRLCAARILLVSGAKTFLAGLGADRKISTRLFSVSEIILSLTARRAVRYRHTQPALKQPFRRS